VFEILRQKFAQTIMLGVGPKVRVIPGELIRRHSEKRDSKNRFIGIENGEFVEKVFGLTPGNLGVTFGISLLIKDIILTKKEIASASWGWQFSAVSTI
jgi:hypothetical protein